MTSKQLGALLNRVPSATAAGQHTASRSVPYASRPADPAPAPELKPPLGEELEVPLQVLLPRHVRVQLDRMHAETRKPLRALTLEALRAIGIEVSDADIAGKRGRKKS